MQAYVIPQSQLMNMNMEAPVMTPAVMPVAANPTGNMQLQGMTGTVDNMLQTAMIAAPVVEADATMAHQVIQNMNDPHVNALNELIRVAHEAGPLVKKNEQAARVIFNRWLQTHHPTKVANQPVQVMLIWWDLLKN